jgi:hypothetical protein
MEGVSSYWGGRVVSWSVFRQDCLQQGSTGYHAAAQRHAFGAFFLAKLYTDIYPVSIPSLLVYFC